MSESQATDRRAERAAITLGRARDLGVRRRSERRSYGPHLWFPQRAVKGRRIRRFSLFLQPFVIGDSLETLG